MIGWLSSSSPRARRTRGWALGACAAIAIAALGGAAEAADPCGRVRIVTIYDSHGLTPFGDALDAWALAYPSVDLTSYTLGGASPSWLLRTPVSPRGYLFKSCEAKPILPRAKLRQQTLQAPALADLLRVPEGTYDKQVVIITLGTNVPGAPAVQAAPVESIVRTIKARSDTVCIWIGPPSIRKWSSSYSDQVYQALRDGIRAAAPAPSKGPACHLIDSRKLSTYPPGGDGFHYGFAPSSAAAAKQWAEGVGREIERIIAGQAPDARTTEN